MAPDIPALSLKIVFSAVALLAAGAHVLWPELSIDGVTLVLLALAILPWLAPLFKRVELPGGLTVEFRELEEAEKRAEAAGLLASAAEVPGDAAYSFQLVADEDPNLALAGLRLEIQRRLTEIGERRGFDMEGLSVRRALRLLAKHGALTDDDRAVLVDLIALLNQAVHGAEVHPNAAEWALEVGPRILEGLDHRVEVFGWSGRRRGATALD